MLYGNSDMKKIYLKPLIVIADLECVILAASGPGADDIGSPNVLNDAKEYSIWDEVENTYNRKEGYDLLEKKTFRDWNDIANGQYGVVLGFLCAWLLM